MSKERRLGRGLEALLGRPLTASSDDTDASTASPPTTGLVQLSVYEIDSNPFQPRRDFDETAIGELTESIKTHGLLQPLVVRRHGNRWQLMAGERRLRAVIKAGWSEVPAQVREADDRQMAEIAIVENLQRKDLNPLEKAASFQDYLQRYQCTQEELAGRLQIDRSTIANLIRLLELPSSVQDAVRSGSITQGHARALLPLGDEQRQMEICQRIQAETLSVRAVEELVQDVIHQEDSSASGIPLEPAKRGRVTRRRPEHIALLEKELRTALGTKVDVRQNTSGKGKLVVHFANAAEFERLREQLCERAIRSHAG